jgi:hypothetical protein
MHKKSAFYKKYGVIKPRTQEAPSPQYDDMYQVTLDHCSPDVLLHENQMVHSTRKVPKTR